MIINHEERERKRAEIRKEFFEKQKHDQQMYQQLRINILIH